jgi:predicted kinase
MRALVVQMQGVPASGKSTVARGLGHALGAVVLDKDVLKASLMRAGLDGDEAGPASYEAYFALARDLVEQGHDVILDNPVFWRRVEENWFAVSDFAGSPRVLIECVCPDLNELNRRLLSRNALVSQPREMRDAPPGLTFTAFEPRLTIDTTRPTDEVVADALTYVRSCIAKVTRSPVG